MFQKLGVSVFLLSRKLSRLSCLTPFLGLFRCLDTKEIFSLKKERVDGAMSYVMLKNYLLVIGYSILWLKIRNFLFGGKLYALRDKTKKAWYLDYDWTYGCVPPIKLSTLNDANIEQDGIWLLSNLTSFLQLYWASLFCPTNKEQFFGRLSNESLEDKAQF